jgi:hypothetical protein
LVQKDRHGKWFRADLPSYAQAFGGVKLRLSECWDMTIHCKPQGFKPPVAKVNGKKIWIPMPEGHSWCSFCRRPTVFQYYEKHPNCRFVTPEELRCLICGARKSFMPEYRSPELWPLPAAQQLKS